MASDHYPLQRNHNETKRLNTQHENWTRAVGYHIHPLIAERLPMSPSIADIGTGSAAFLLDVSKQFPATSRLDGFDISNTQFPQHIPANVKLHVHDLRTAFPPQFHGVFDLVHVRLIFTALDPGEWHQVVANLVQLLNVNGAIQWIEPDATEAKTLRSKGPSTSQWAIRGLQTAFHKMCGDKNWLAKKLPDVYEANGLQDVFQDQAATDRDAELRMAMTSATYRGMFGWARLQQDKQLPGLWTSNELDKLAEQCEAELAMGAYMRFEIYISIGFLGDKDATNIGQSVNPASR